MRRFAPLALLAAQRRSIAMTEHDTQTIPAGQSSHRAKRQRRLLTVVGAAAIFLAGTGVGVAVGHPAPARAPSPVVSSTVRYAPQACLDALDKAEAALGRARTGVGYSAELMGISGDGFRAAARFDVDGIEDATARMNGVTGKIVELTPQMGVAVTEYQTAAQACRTAS